LLLQWGVHLLNVMSTSTSTVAMWIPFDVDGASFRERQPELWMRLLQMFARGGISNLQLAGGVQYVQYPLLTPS
jgi:hypothetical protein